MKLSVSVIVPLFNGSQTIKKTLASLFGQSLFFEELIIINNGSTDDSLGIVEKIFFEKNEKKISIKIVNHAKPSGLSRTYNEGIGIATGDLIVTLHQDIVLFDNSLAELVKPFGEKNSDDIVATTHIVSHPYEIWNSYNFWGKVYFARLVGKDYKGLDGKFDCFRKKTLETVGLFDELHFRSAGEDGDIIFRLKKIGRIEQTKAKIIHLHNISKKFGPKDIIYKQKQYSEAQGVLLRLGRINTINNFTRSFFREILIVFLFIPYINYFSLALILIYSIWYSKIIFIKECKNFKIFLVPFLNLYLLPVSFFYSLRAFVYGKQRI